jgi:hypothetical protein
MRLISREAGKFTVAFSRLEKTTDVPVAPAFVATARPLFGVPSSQSWTRLVTSTSTKERKLVTDTAVANAAPSVGAVEPVTLASLHDPVTGKISIEPVPDSLYNHNRRTALPT